MNMTEHHDATKERHAVEMQKDSNAETKSRVILQSTPYLLRHVPSLVVVHIMRTSSQVLRSKPELRPACSVREDDELRFQEDISEDVDANAA